MPIEPRTLGVIEIGKAPRCVDLGRMGQRDLKLAHGKPPGKMAGLRVRISLRPTQLRVRHCLAGRSGNTIVLVCYAVLARIGYGLQMT